MPTNEAKTTEPESRDKRKHNAVEASPGDGTQGAEKLLRNLSPPPLGRLHESVQLISTPVTIGTTRLASLRSPLSLEHLYTMVKNLDQRVTNQQGEITELKEQLKAKDEENTTLRAQLSGDTEDDLDHRTFLASLNRVSTSVRRVGESGNHDHKTGG